jgi:hypothetical protein
MKVSGVKKVAACSLVLGTASVSPLRAEESRPGVPLPGLESDPAGTVVPRSCTVSVMARNVRVDLSAGTTADTPALLLSGPFFGWNGASDPYPDRHFPELEIRIDAAPVTPEDRFEAFVGKTNVTNLIKWAEMDPWAISRTPPLTSAHPKNAQVLNGLKNVNAIEPSGDGYLAHWTARRLIRIPLKAVPVQRVELSYTLRPATSLMTADQLDTTSREKSFCITPDQLKRLARSGSPAATLTVNEFTMATGIDGKPPTSVILNVSQNSGGEVSGPTYLFFCGPHGKPTAKRGSVTRERIEVDDQGIVRVLSVSAAPRS